jgi:hypothetical protein
VARAVAATAARPGNWCLLVPKSHFPPIFTPRLDGICGTRRGVTGEYWGVKFPAEIVACW